MENELLNLVEKAAEADKEAFETLCKIKYKDILYICISIMGNVPDGEDAAQEVLLRMQSNITRLRAPVAFPAWLNKMIFSVCSNIKRSRSKELFLTPIDELPFLLEEENTMNLPQPYLETQDKRQQILQVLNSLPTQYRLMLLWHYNEGLSQKEIADILQLSVSAVKAGLYRTRKLLKAKLKKSGIPVNGLLLVPALTDFLR